MKNFAKVRVIATAIETNAKDPTKEYLKVLFCQGTEAVTFNVSTVTDFDTLSGMIGEEVWCEFKYNPTYKNMTFSAICDSPQ